MSDKELLELAAKAVGIKLGGETNTGYVIQILEKPYITTWNPPTNTRDLYDLAKKLKFVIDFSDETVLYFCPVVRTWEYLEDMNISIERRIVRAAAELGKRMK
jgi:hypothetical protein